MQNKKLKTEDFEVSGRTMPLTFIAKKCWQVTKSLWNYRPTKSFKTWLEKKVISALDEFNEFCTSKEKSTEKLLNELKVFERSRHLMVYHDSSTIADHTHFLVMVSAMYDQAVYHTNEEYQNLYNVNIDV